MSFKNVVHPTLNKNKFLVNQVLKKLLKRKPLFSLPLIGMGLIFNTNSSFANLKDEYNNPNCSIETATHEHVRNKEIDKSNIPLEFRHMVVNFYCVPNGTEELWEFSGSYNKWSGFTLTEPRLIGLLNTKISPDSVRLNQIVSNKRIQNKDLIMINIYKKLSFDTNFLK